MRCALRSDTLSEKASIDTDRDFVTTLRGEQRRRAFLAGFGILATESPLMSIGAPSGHFQAFGIRDGHGRVRAALACQLAAGRTIDLAATMPEMDPAEVTQRQWTSLFRAGLTFGAARGARLAMLYLSPGQRLQFCGAELAGFRPVARVLAIAVPIRRIIHAARQTNRGCDLRLLAVPSWRDRSFQEIVAATYEGSRDCPDLNSIDNFDDAIAYQCQNIDSSCLLLLDGTERLGAMILVRDDRSRGMTTAYLGLKPEFRGAGLANHLIAAAAVRAEAAKCEFLTASVDAHNRPALRLYSRWGFRSNAESDLLVAVLSSSSPGNAG